MAENPHSQFEDKPSRPGERLFAVLFMLTGILGWYFAADMTSGSYSSPSVIPKTASLILAVSALTVLVKTVSQKTAYPQGALLAPETAVLLIFIFFYCLVLPLIHFVPASYIFMAASMLYSGKGKNIPLCLISPAVTLALVVLVFRYVFLVILP